MIGRVRESRKPQKVIRVSLRESYGERRRVPVNLFVIGHPVITSENILSGYQIKCNILFSDRVCSHGVISMRYEVLNFENIRNLRIDNSYTQQQIADYLNIKQNTYSQYETGVLNYPVDILMKLADLYDVSVDYLLGRTDVKKPYPKKEGK